MASILYLMANETVTLAVLLACVTVPVFSLALMASANNMPELNIISTGENGFNIQVGKAGRIGLVNVALETNLKNKRTGIVEQNAFSVPVGRKAVSVNKIETSDSNAGKYELTCSCLQVTDALGLFRREAKGECIKEYVVRPSEFEVSVYLGASSAVMLESDNYSNSRNGNDPGEVRGIREYVIGDQIKNIHWKLSEKNDKLFVKELGLPVTEQVMVVLDTLVTDELAGEGFDAIAAVFSSVMRSLVRMEVDFSVGWSGEGGEEFVTRKVESEDDLEEIITEVLSLPPAVESVTDRMINANMQNRMAHLIYIGARAPEGLDELLKGCKVTALVYGINGSSVTQDGVSTIGFDEYSYKNLLAEMEV